MDNSDIQVLESIKSAELEAAKLILGAKAIMTSTKTDRRDVVTQYDKQVQALLMERLSQAVPGAGFFCEERAENDNLDAEHLFIIDPIDGTMNFVKGFNHSCISVAYSSRSEIRAAAVYNPFMDEMFSAVKGGGAFLNSQPIHAAETSLAESVVCCGTSPYNTILKDLTFDMMKKAFSASLDIRREGSAALDLCSVAAGRAGIYFELSTSLWDIAAGSLIASEAGAELSDINGDPLLYGPGKTSIAAGRKSTLEEFTELVRNPNVRRRK